MAILTEEHQQEILLSYQRDYCLVVRAYNRLGASKNKAAINMLFMQAGNLRDEINRYSSKRKSCFNEQNAEFAQDIAQAIAEFINTHTRYNFTYDGALFTKKNQAA